MTSLPSFRRWWALGMVAVTLAAAWWFQLSPSRVAPPTATAPATLREPTAPLSLAATGDTLIARPWPEAGHDAGFDGVTAILGRSSIALTNLEQILIEGDSGLGTGWPVGPARIAADLRRIGITVVSRANNHAADRGDDGIRSTTEFLTRAGVLHAGAGSDLGQALAPIVVGTSPKRVAVISIATSASDEARATKTRGEIRGRPGVSELRYAVEITADPPTYAALAQVAQASGTDAQSAAGFRLSGRLVKKGTNTSVDLVADASDRDELLNAIAAARADADVVVVAIHSHEPANLSQVPATFVRDFARQAIERGATIVVGTGPRQLRGIEVYRGCPIFYSLGNFAFDAASIPLGAADVFDANTNLTEMALGQAVPPRLPTYDEAIWWESVVATTTFGDAGTIRIRLDPIDLGADLPLSERGRPRLAARDRGAAILQRLAALSKVYGTTVEIEDGGGMITIPHSSP